MNTKNETFIIRRIHFIRRIEKIINTFIGNVCSHSNKKFTDMMFAMALLTSLQYLLTKLPAETGNLSDPYQ